MNATHLNVLCLLYRNNFIKNLNNFNRNQCPFISTVARIYEIDTYLPLIQLE